MSDKQRCLAMELADRCRDRDNPPDRHELDLLADLLEEIFDPPDAPTRKRVKDTRRYWVAREFFQRRNERHPPVTVKEVYFRLRERWGVADSYIDKARVRYQAMKDRRLSTSDWSAMEEFRTKISSDR
jgi:hypothetical protein